jgi:hypothetical protein
MSQMFQLNVPEHIVERAQEVAAYNERKVEDILLDWLQHAAEEVPVDTLPDDQVLALAELQMDAEQDRELSELLAQQREREISDAGRARLDALMTI